MRINPRNMRSVKPKKFSEVLEESPKVEVTLPPVKEEEDKEPKVETEVVTEDTVEETTNETTEPEEEEVEEESSDEE